MEGARAAGDALKGVRGPVAEAITAWVVVIGGLGLIQVAGRWFPPLRGLVGALAVAAFLYVPLRLLERAGQDAHDAGWRFDRMGRDLLWSLGVCVVVLPLFAVGFVHFWRWAAHLPHEWRSLLAPDSRDRPFHLRMPPINFDFLGQVAGNAAVAFSEDFFYRGYMTLRFGERWRPLPSALAAATFFALGHLLTPSPFRLAVFFPALLFAFLRQRTGTIVGAAIAHFLCNVWLIILEYSLY